MVDKEEKEELLKIRTSLRHGAYGDDKFLENLKKKLSEDEAKEGQSFKTESNSLEKIIETVCCHPNVSLENIQSSNRSQKFVETRAIMALLIQKQRTLLELLLIRKIMPNVGPEPLYGPFIFYH